MKEKNALLSLFDKTGSERCARELVSRGYNIVSSGGTAKYLREKGVSVTDISEITGYKPVLKHRVVTLAPQIHGGLLATPELYPELDELGWKKIDLLYVTFYPLQEELERPGATFESCLEKTDIGGPTMIRSANKGGEVIVMTDRSQWRDVSDWIQAGEPDRESYLFRLRAAAEAAVSKYVALSAEVYRRFGKEFSYGDAGDFPRYLMKVGDHVGFLPFQDAVNMYDNGHIQVDFGDLVLEGDLSVRKMTDGEKSAISNAADRYSTSK